MRAAGKNSQTLELIMTLVVAAMIVLMALQAIDSGTIHQWLLSKLPFWFVVEALFIIIYARHHARESDKRSLDSRTKSNALTWMYFVPCTAAAMLVKYFLPPDGEAIYNACYWALASVTVFCLIWFVSLPDRRTTCSGTTRRVLAFLFVLTGIASGPPFVLWSYGPDGGSPAIAIAGVILIAPLLLRELELFSFRPLRFGHAAKAE